MGKKLLNLLVYQNDWCYGEFPVLSRLGRIN